MTTRHPISSRSAPLPRSGHTTAVLTPPSEQPTRDVILGRYRLDERLGAGGMAEVFRGHRLHGFYNAPLAIKRIHSHLAANATFRAMFVREAKLCAQLKHPGIVSLVDFEAGNHGLFLVFELVDGPDLRGVLKSCAKARKRMPAAVAVFIAAHLLEALDYAHTLRLGGKPLSIIHRDVSPSNVLLTWRGKVKLSDFGVARVSLLGLEHIGDSLLTGKLGYISPEHILGDALDVRSDLFSVGIVLAEMLTCRRLFVAETKEDVSAMVLAADIRRFRRYGDDVALGLRAIVEKALSRERCDRFATAIEFRDALTEWLAAAGARTGAHQLAEFLGELKTAAVTAPAAG